MFRTGVVSPLAHAVRVPDPIHVVRAADPVVDKVCRHVQQETLGIVGTKGDPHYRIRRLLTKVEVQLEESKRKTLQELLRAGDPRGEAATTWHAKQACEFYTHGHEATARESIERPVADMADPDSPLHVTLPWANAVPLERPDRCHRMNRAFTRWVCCVCWATGVSAWLVILYP